MRIPVSEESQHDAARLPAQAMMADHFPCAGTENDPPSLKARPCRSKQVGGRV
jgi:hypothetical protein